MNADPNVVCNLVPTCSLEGCGVDSHWYLMFFAFPNGAKVPEDFDVMAWIEHGSAALAIIGFASCKEHVETFKTDVLDSCDFTLMKDWYFTRLRAELITRGLTPPSSNWTRHALFSRETIDLVARAGTCFQSVGV